MTKSVVPVAAAAHAKQLVRNKKSIKRTEDQAPAQDGQQATDEDPNSAHAVQVDQSAHLPMSMSDTTMAGDFSFGGALAAAAAETTSLMEAALQDSGGMGDDDGDGAGGTILLVGAVGLVGLGVAVLAGGGGGNRNDPPTVSAATQAITTDEDKAVSGTVSATDPDGDTLAFSAAGATKGAVTIDATGKFTYTPNKDFNGTDSFTVTVKDPEGLTATQTVNVTVKAVNDAPTVSPATQTVTTAEDTAVVITVAGADVDTGDKLTYSATSTKGGTFTVADNKITYTPALDFNGTDTVTVTVKDTAGATATQTVTVDVTPVNDAPRANAATTTTLTIAEDSGPAVIVVDFTDPENNTPLVGPTVTTAPTKGVFALVGGQNTYTPNANANGTDTIVYTVKDSTGATTTQTVNITITPVNDAPTVANAIADRSTSEDDPFTFTVPANTFADIDSTALTLSATLENGSPLPAWLTFNAATATFTGTPPDAGAINVKVTASDGALSVSDTFTLTVTPDIATVSLDQVGVDANTPKPIAVGATPFILTETPTGNSDVIVTGFSKDDQIRVTGATGPSQYSYGTASGDANDLVITLNGGGLTNIIVIDEILPTGGPIVSTYENALTAVRAALGADASYNFMVFA